MSTALDERRVVKWYVLLQTCVLSGQGRFPEFMSVETTTQLLCIDSSLDEGEGLCFSEQHANGIPNPQSTDDAVAASSNHPLLQRFAGQRFETSVPKRIQLMLPRNVIRSKCTSSIPSYFALIIGIRWFRTIASTVTSSPLSVDLR